jgi:uncharacterized protein
MLRFVAFIGLLAALVSDAAASPSFDCDKAKSPAEKKVCATPDLEWFDRQLARLYRLARYQAEDEHDALLVEQRAFLDRRDACWDEYDCLLQIYETRLLELGGRVNVHEAYAEYRPKKQGGSLWIVRYGFDAAVKILTIGDASHTCALETDSAQVGGKGVIRWKATAGNACRIDIIPDGHDMRVETHDCQDACGMRATMDGRYSRAP